MTESIESISLGVGASIVLPVVAMTGIVGRIRSPYPPADAAISPADGSVFTAGVTEDGIRIVGVAEGEGILTLIAGPNQSQRTDYRVVVEATNNTVRWVFGFGGVITEGTVVSPPMDVDVIVNDQRVQLTFSGAGSDQLIDIDWGDGSSETFNPVDNGGRAQHDYDANGNYIIIADPQDAPDMVYPPVDIAITINHYPIVVVDTAADPLVNVSHDKGDISTVVNWGDGQEDTDLADSFDHVYAQNGTYTVTTTVGGFPPVAEDVTIAAADLGGVSVPPTDAVCYGPFDAGGIMFWVCTSATNSAWFSVAFDIDTDPDPDVQLNMEQLRTLWAVLTQEQKAVMSAKIREVRSM